MLVWMVEHLTIWYALDRLLIGLEEFLDKIIRLALSYLAPARDSLSRPEPRRHHVDQPFGQVVDRLTGVQQGRRNRHKARAGRRHQPTAACWRHWSRRCTAGIR